MNDEEYKVPDHPLAKAMIQPLVDMFRALNGRNPRPDDIAFCHLYSPEIHVSSRDHGILTQDEKSSGL